MTGQSPFKKLFEDRQPPPPEPTPSKPSPETLPVEPPRRGRPPTGKRSDPGWIGRTYYVQKETDLDVEEELLKLKRQGIEIDKSELVNILLGAWVKSQQGEDLNLLLGKIPPRRKS